MWASAEYVSRAGNVSGLQSRVPCIGSRASSFSTRVPPLDTVTERELMAALVPLRGERTIIAVAHRLTTVAAADRVILVDGGRLVDVAPFDELAARHAQLRVTAG